MNVSLTPELAKIVNEKVRGGMYHSASEVIREGLRLLYEQDMIKRVRLQELRQEINIGLEQAERRESKPLHMKDVIVQVRKQIKSRPA
jgi:antitoxin ParD1/3/4